MGDERGVPIGLPDFEGGIRRIVEVGDRHHLGGVKMCGRVVQLWSLGSDRCNRVRILVAEDAGELASIIRPTPC
jgi:hypothetical protein